MSASGLIPIATKRVGQIIQANGRESRVAKAIGSDTKGKLSVCLFAVGVGLAWLSPWIAYSPIAYSLYGSVALLWFVPDRRLTSRESV